MARVTQEGAMVAEEICISSKHKHIKTIKEGAPHSSVIRGQCAGRNKKNEPYIASQNEESRKTQVSRKVGKGTRSQSVADSVLRFDYLHNRAKLGTSKKVASSILGSVTTLLFFIIN